MEKDMEGKIHWLTQGNILAFALRIRRKQIPYRIDCFYIQLRRFRSERICSVDSWKFSVSVMKFDRLLHVVLNTKRLILPVPLLIQSRIHTPAATLSDRWTRLLSLSGLLVIVRVKVKPCFHRPPHFTHPIFHYVAAAKVARMRCLIKAEWNRSECPHTSVTHRRNSERLFAKIIT
jgi:hypothetical protein